jgi:hypothetical protein
MCYQEHMHKIKTNRILDKTLEYDLFAEILDTG